PANIDDLDVGARGHKCKRSGGMGRVRGAAHGLCAIQNANDFRQDSTRASALVAASNRAFWLRPMWSAHTRSTKLSTTRFSPALSNAMVSLLPSTATTL